MPNHPESPPPLRDRALACSADSLGLVPTSEHPNVFGILMETGYPEGAATLVVFLEGSTSLYFTGGGGIIGAGEHDSVRATHPRFFAEAEARLGAFQRAADTPLPETGRVRFYIRTFGGTLTAEASEDDLGNERHPLSDLFYAGHAVISATREASGG